MIRLKPPAIVLPRVAVTPTLSEGLLDVPSHAHERVLRCVSRGGHSGVRVDGCGDGPADGVAGGGARRAGTLSLQHRKQHFRAN